jgi:hypothetical protein
MLIISLMGSASGFFSFPHNLLCRPLQFITSAYHHFCFQDTILYCNISLVLCSFKTYSTCFELRTWSFKADFFRNVIDIDHLSSLSDITPSYYATTFINWPRHVSASFIRPSSGGYFLSWSLLHLSAKPRVRVSCFVVHNKLSGSP